MFGMSEKHGDECSMDDDEECMECVAPGAEGPVRPGGGRRIVVVKECLVG